MCRIQKAALIKNQQPSGQNRQKKQSEGE